MVPEISKIHACQGITVRLEKPVPFELTNRLHLWGQEKGVVEKHKV